MSKMKKHKPIPFAELDQVRKSIQWHMMEIGNLYAQLEPHKTQRGFTGARHDNGSVIIIFKGTVEDIFQVKEFLEGEDNEK